MSGDEKKRLYGIMADYGAKGSFSYVRFFRDGFDLWELEGIDNIKRAFIAENVDVLFSAYEENVVAPVTDGARTEILMSYVSASPYNFYTLLGFVHGCKSRFCEIMREKGMSMATFYRRFSEEDWRPYERVGIHKVWEDFVNECQPTA